jgi:hypothetical protein
MSDPEAAAEHLKVIRGMMERATVYRAISGPAAIFGGLLAVLVGGYFLRSASDGEFIDAMRWFWVWVSALLAVGVFNALLLWRKSCRASEPFLSAGMRHAVFAIAPPLIAGGLLSYEFVRADDLENGVLTWVLCYGAALLAMTHFAPRSLRRLGIAFLLSGAIIVMIWGRFGSAMEARLGLDERVGAAAWIMILTFGFLHLAYGLVVMLRGEREEQSA